MDIASSANLPGSPTTTTQAAGDSSTKIATDAFVTTAIANAIAAVNPAVAVQAATTGAANTSSYTYNNGVSGIGATLTGVANTALTVDGYTFTALGQRLLVKNDTQSPSGAFNGVYYVTQVQTALLPVILTRALDYDAPSDINNTGAIPVVNGTINALTSWLLTSSVATVGTDPLTYTEFSATPVGAALSVLGVTGNASAIRADIAAASDGQVLRRSGTAVAFGAVSLSTAAAVTGALGVANGGTGDATLAAHGVLVGNGASAVSVTGTGTTGQMLVSNGPSADPTFQTVSGGATSGTWTPTLTFGGGSTGLTYAIQLGIYTIIGKLVFCSLSIQLSNKGSSTGNAVIGGLPAAANSTASQYQSVMGWTSAGSVFFQGLIAQAAGVTSTQFGMYSAALAAITAASFGNTTQIIMNFCYQTD